MVAAPVKIISIFGTRPEAIKMAPVIKLLEREKSFSHKTILTGQHEEMLTQVLDIFSLKADYNLKLMEPEQRLADLTARCITGLTEIIQSEKPALILVHGDTTTTLTASLAAFYQQIPLGHVEAGLRTGDKYSPFPEEINRSLTDRLADLHFAPTGLNQDNLREEGIVAEKIFITGNTVIDAVQEIVGEDYALPEELPLSAVDFQRKKVILLTAHRRENLGANMKNIFLAAREIIEKHQETELIFPVHLNPKVRRIAEEFLAGEERIHLLKPLDYLTFINLVHKSYLVLTDSGGIQEEAPGLGVPVVLLRETTERPEAIKAGVVKKAGTDRDRIISLTSRLINDKDFYQSTAEKANPYGDGRAARRIKNVLLEHFNFAQDVFTPFSIE